MDIKRLAKMCRVSPMTVSRAFRNYQIARETRDRILETAKKYHYRPNIIARSLSTQKSPIIGLIVPNIIQSFFPYVIRAVENLIYKRGYNLILCDSQEDEQREKEQIRLLIDQRVRGIIIIPVAIRKEARVFEEIKQADIPFIFVDRYVKGVKASFVGVNDYQGGFIATEHLIKLGHRKILHLKGPDTASVAKDRFHGYRDALRNAGIKIDSELIVESGLEEESGYQTIKKIFQHKPKFSAIFAVNDPVATGAMRALGELNVKIPDDISVVGFANLDHTSDMSVPLTTINQPKEEIGEMAGKILLEKIERRGTIQRVVFEPELILRQSVKKL